MDKFIKVKVYTEQKKQLIKRISDDKLELYIKEKPLNNIANNMVLEMVSEYLKTKRLKIISGHKRKNKIISFIEN